MFKLTRNHIIISVEVSERSLFHISLETIVSIFSILAIIIENAGFPDSSFGKQDRLPIPVFLGFPCSSAGKESACNAGDPGFIPGSGRSPGEGIGYPLQYSGLKNSMDCIVHGATESDTTEQRSIYISLLCFLLQHIYICYELYVIIFLL